jgi:hypothetical protein
LHVATFAQKLARREAGRGTKRFAKKEREAVVGIPVVVRPAVVVVQPALGVVVIDVEERGIAVRVALY